MSKAEYTPEPWYLMTNPIQISDSTEHTNKAAIVHWSGFDSGDKSQQKKLANARRIIACVNACAGLPQDALDGGWTAKGSSAYGKSLEAERDTLRRQRDMLAEALKEVVWIRRPEFPGDPYCALCGAGKKWAAIHGHQKTCALAAVEKGEA